MFIHLSALLIISAFRVASFFSSGYHLPEDTGFMLILPAFIRGIWFDNVIGCYILLLPLITVSISSQFNYYGKALWKSICIFFSLFYSIVFLISAANILYFSYFFKIINSSIFNWFEYMNTTASMVLGETSYYPAISSFLVATTLFIILIAYISRKKQLQLSKLTAPNRISDRIFILLFALACIGLCLFGIRGRIGYNPIKISAAYYCTNPFLNQLGINPAFNLLSSILDEQRKENRYLNLIPEEKALQNVQYSLNRKGVPGISPIARQVISSDTLHHPNIVMIFMESMSVDLMKRFGQKKTLTPFLDSIYPHTIGFPNFYSSGIHTNHGIYSTLYSFPVIMKRNAMKGTVVPIYSGLPTVLKENGYQTMFFMTHESQYDNMNAFLRTNGFDEIFSQENYPSKKVVSGFGVQDDFLYDYALERIKERTAKGKPFFTVLLSVSNHPPYIIPPYFHPDNKEREDQIVEYADWAIREFMKKAANEVWFKNTLFVLLGDHGKMVGNADCEMPQSYNHIPLMIYAPSDLVCLGQNFAREEPGFGGQIDVAPTLLGMLNIDYLQNNFGVDLLKEKRPCMFFTADNMIGARNDSCLYIYVPENNQEFGYTIENGKLCPTKNNDLTDSLKNYASSMLQTTEYLVKKQLTTDKPRTN